MGITTTLTEKQEEFINYAISRLINKKEEDDKILIEVKTLLNSTFGEENNQIQKNTTAPKEWAEGHIRETIERKRYGLPVYNSYSNVSLFNLIFRETIKHKVYIRFPEVEISNGKDTHTITDLWVHFLIDKDGIIYDAIQGTRSSVTAEEFLAGYKHSHLYAGYHSRAFSAFCLGSGPLVGLINKLSHEYDKGVFQMFLLNIKQYVKWESIAGTPYIEMARVRNKRGFIDMDMRSIGSDNLLTFIRMCEKTFLPEVADLSSHVNLTLEGGRIVAKIDDVLERQMATFFQKTGSVLDLNSFLCYKNTDGSYVSGASVDVNIPKHEPIFEFKGEKIYLTISNKVQNVTEKQKYLHPIFKYQLESWLSNHFSSHSKVETDTAEKKHTS